MKALMLVSDAFGGRGGIAKFNRDFITALCEYPRCDEVVAVPRIVVEPLGELPPQLTYVAPPSSTKAAFIKAAVTAGFRPQSYDLVICGHVNLLPVAFAASLINRASLLLIIYGIDVWEPHRNLLTRWLTAQLDAVISISEITLSKFCTWSRSLRTTSFILPNAVDLARYYPGPKPEYLLRRYRLAGRRVILTLGRISADERYKGFDEVLDVLPDIRRVVPNIAYLIAGDGSDRKRLEQKVKQCGLAESVVFTGYLSEDEKVDHFRLADAFVMPSRREGFGFVFLEAMACGIPVVASCIDGGYEAVRHGMLGAVVDPDNREGLTQSILDALNKPKGVVPQGLEYFAYPHFQKRVHSCIDHILGESIQAL